MNEIKKKSDKNRALDILEEGFHDVPSIMWMITAKRNRRRSLRTILSFCLQETSEKRGAYITSDRNGVVFFYHLKDKANLFFTFFRTLYLILVIVGLKQSLCVMKTRKMIDAIRPKHGWYGWFLATDKNVVGTHAGYEIKRDMFRMADDTNETIYVETTIRRIMILYRKIGFHEYAKMKHPYLDLEIWFMKRAPHSSLD